MEVDVKNLPLTELAKMYLKRLLESSGKKFDIFENVERITLDGKRRIKFDFIIRDHTTGEIVGVIVKDWKRPIGINVALKVERDVEECGLSYGILIGSQFSGVVEGRKFNNLILVSRGVMISHLVSFLGEKADSS